MGRYTDGQMNGMDEWKNGYMHPWIEREMMEACMRRLWPHHKQHRLYPLAHDL